MANGYYRTTNGYYGGYQRSVWGYQTGDTSREVKWRGAGAGAEAGGELPNWLYLYRGTFHK